MRLEDLPARLSDNAVRQVLEAASRIIDSRSPRGVGEFNFDEGGGEPSSKPTIEGGEPSKPTVAGPTPTILQPCSALAPFTRKSEEGVITWMTYIACEFVEDVLMAVKDYTQYFYRMRIQPNDVAEALRVFATTYANFDKYRAFPHGLSRLRMDDKDDVSRLSMDDEDDDESIDGTASEAHESDEELDCDSEESDSELSEADDELSEAEIERMRVRDSNSEAPVFDEAFPNDQSIEILDGKEFVVRVAKSRAGDYIANWLEESDSVTRIINRAMYAFLVAKLSTE